MSERMGVSQKPSQTSQLIFSFVRNGIQQQYSPHHNTNFRLKPLSQTTYRLLRKTTIVSIPPEDNGEYDIYIDDTIAVGPDINDKASRLETAILLQCTFPVALYILMN